MGYALDQCPTLHRCCMSVPLRVGVALVGVLGVLGAAALAFLFTGVGMQALAELGVGRDTGRVMRYVHGVLAVLLCAVHVLLLLAALWQSDALCELYVWSMLLCWALLAAAAAVLAVSAVIAGAVLFACALLFLTFLTILVSFYFTIVVANYRMTLP